MASRAFSPLLPTSWFRRRPSAPFPDPEEAEKRQWIDEQKRLIAEAMQRSGGPDPRWNNGDKYVRREVKGRRTAVIEELSASEIRKKRWMAEHQRSIARENLLSRFEAALHDGQLHPVVSTKETADDPAKSVPEEEEERKRIEPDDNAELAMKSAIEKNQWGGRRHSEEYYARRRQVLQSFKFVTDESEKAGVRTAPRSACARRRRNVMSVLGFARVPAAARTCCTG